MRSIVVGWMGGHMDVTVADLGEWQNTATDHVFAAGLSEEDIVPCRGNTTLDDCLHLN
jgi:hypothetical protein